MPDNERSPRLESGLAGIRVLDFTGPSAALAAKWLADLGADVVRVEPPEGDPSRRLPPLAAGDEGPDDLASLHFWYFNTNKRSLTLDLQSSEGRSRLLDLIPNVDVVLECFPPGYLAGLGLGPEVLRERNPGLVIGSTTPFGQTGPFRDFLGSDLIGWASGGCLMLNGHPDRPPVTAPALQAYQVASLYLITGVLAAVFRRRQDGRGAHLDVSVQEAVGSMCEGIHSFYSYLGERIVRLNGDHPLACPFQVYKCIDGWAFLGVSARQQWQSLREWMSATVDTSSVADEKYCESIERIRDRDRVNAVVSAWAQGRTVDEFFRGCIERNLPASPVRTVAQVLDDEQLLDRRFFVAMSAPRGKGSYQSPGLPFRGRAGPFRATSTSAPRPGADTDAVLREWQQPRPGARPIAGGAASPEPLAGVKVLDFTWFIAGPTVTMLLGDLGAEVVKVEAAGIGDPVRGIPPHMGGQVGLERSGTYHSLNRNKRSLTLDLKHPSARTVIERLTRWADVVVENFTQGTLDRLGIGYDTLSGWNPRVILTSLTGYGQTGPRKSWPSYHPTAAAASGLTGLFAYRDSKPIGFANSYFDYVPGYVGALSTIEALLRRETTGRGEHVDVAQLEAATSLAGPEILTWQVNEVVPTAEGNQAGSLGAPLQDVYACREPDTWLAVTVPDRATLISLARLVGLDGIDAVPEEVDRALAAWLKDRDAWDAFHALQGAGVPAGVAEHGPDLLERDEHLRERGLFVELPHAEIGRVPLIRHPVLFDGQPLPIRRAPPLVGEHTEEILRVELGFTEEEVVELIAGEAV